MRHRNIVSIHAFVFIFFSILSIYGQNNSSSLHKTKKYLSTADGLHNRHINSTFIDKNKRIWFLSDNKIGLFEFGKITNFQLSKQFSNRGFNAACEDVSGNFWVTENTEWYYPFNVQRCVIFNPITKKTQSIDEYIRQNLPIHSVISDHRHQVYISTKKGELYQFASKNKSIKKIFSFSNSSLKLMHAGPKGIVVCVEQNSQFDKLIIHLTSEGKIISQNVVKNLFVRSVIESDNKLFYIYRKSKSIALKEIEGSFERNFYISKEAYISTIIYDRSKKFFIVNEGNALSFFDKNFNFIEKEKSNFLIHDVVTDDYGNYISATNDGVHILQLDERKIRTFLSNKEPEKINENFSCRAIISIDKDNIVVNTNRNRQLINLKTASVKTLHNFKNESGESFRFVLAALKDKEGDVLFGEGALVKTNLRAKRDEVLCNLDSTKIWAIEAYKDGYLMGLEKNGVLYYDKKIKKTHPLTGINHEFDNAIVYDFHINKDTLFIASEAGLCRLLGEKSLQKIKFPLADSLQMTCFSLQKDKKNPNQLFVATLHGLWILELTTHIIRPFIQDKNFQSKKYLSAYRTNNGVWTSSEEGVWHFDDNGKLIKIYTVNDGLTSNECNRLAHFQDENDVLYFGGINGLNILNPSDFPNKEETRFNLKIDSVYTYKGVDKNRNFADYKQSSLQLTKSENSLELTFSYEDYKYKCDKKYFYRTDRGFSKEWQPLSDRRLLLSNLEYGTTSIEIMAVSCDNFADAKSRKIIIYRPDPLYLTWYFWVAVCCALSLLIWGSIKYSTYQLKRRNEFLQEKIDEQTQSLKESLALKETLLSLLVHDVRYPVQSFYDLSKKLAYLTKKNDHERLFLLGKETENKSRKVLWLVDELVYWVKSTNKNWQPTISERNLGEVIQSIFDTYSEELLEKELTFDIINADAGAMIDYSLFVIILRNLVFNAIVHSKPKSTICVLISKTEKNTFTINFQNPYESKNAMEKGLGLGLTLLIPLLEKANIRLVKNVSKDTFSTTLEF